MSFTSNVKIHKYLRMKKQLREFEILFHLYYNEGKNLKTVTQHQTNIETIIFQVSRAFGIPQKKTFVFH
jgi:hypothetical protein